MPDKIVTIKRIKRKHCRKLPSILLIGLTFISAIIGILSVNVFEQQLFKGVEAIIANIFTLFAMANILILLPQNVVRNNIFHEMIDAFKAIEHIFIINLHWSMNYEQFRKQYRRKCLFIACSFLQSVLACIWDHVISDQIDIVSVLIKYWQAVSIVTCMHVIFYVDLLKFNLAQLNSAIENQVYLEEESKYGQPRWSFKKVTAYAITIQKIKCYKMVYFRLWEIAQQINKLFGWSILAIIMQCFVDSTYCLYWMHSSIFDRTKIAQILREKISFKKCFLIEYNHISQMMILLTVIRGARG